MKNRLIALTLTVALLTGLFPLTAFAEEVTIPETPPLHIGVTAARFDNVYQILRYFGSDQVVFHQLTSAQLNDIAFLQDLYAVFINCGSHHQINPETLYTFVYYGGIVYISDLAGDVLQTAFPNIVDFSNANAMTIQADVIHSTLAAHMRLDQLDVHFNMSGWAVITELADHATVYMQGYVLGNLTPLAMSFSHGRGQVFYTSFHNSAQATGQMVDFIEYLIFRIIHVHADRNMQHVAQESGFVYHGAVFATPVAREMLTPGPTDIEAGLTVFSLSPDTVVTTSPMASHAMEVVESAPSPFFSYTFAGQAFMLIFDQGVAIDTIHLIDPMGNLFVVDGSGHVTHIAESTTMPAFDLHLTDAYRLTVTGGVAGEWQFYAIAQGDSTASLMIGIAVLE